MYRVGPWDLIIGKERLSIKKNSVVILNQPELFELLTLQQYSERQKEKSMLNEIDNQKINKAKLVSEIGAIIVVFVVCVAIVGLLNWIFGPLE